MSKFHGKFIWYELMTTDPKAAEAFYRGVIGWNAKDSGVPGMSYTIFSAGETGVAGLMTVPEAARAAGLGPVWTGYIAVDDVDACTTRVKQAGGAVHRAAEDIPGVGRFAVVADPQGATFNLFKPFPDGEENPPPPSTPGHAGWRELLAADWPAAFDFYADLFGWTKAEAIDMGATGVYQIFVHDGVPIGGMMTKPETVPAPFWGYYFNVKSIQAGMERIRAGGGTIVNGPHEVPGGSWIVHGLDPQGAKFALVGARD